jgi:hypothetical protein
MLFGMHSICTALALSLNAPAGTSQTVTPSRHGSPPSVPCPS